VWIASAIGLVAQRRMSPVALVSGGEREIPLVPSLSRSELWQAIEPLRTRGVDEQTTLGAQLRRVAQRATRASVMFILSDLHDPDAIPAIRHAAQKHDCSVIHLVDPVETKPLRAGFFRGREAETGRRFVGTSATVLGDVDLMRDELLRSGADYLRLATDAPFIPALRHHLGSRGALNRGRG
jgi:hypothetical protein